MPQDIRILVVCSTSTQTSNSLGEIVERVFREKFAVCQVEFGDVNVIFHEISPNSVWGLQGAIIANNIWRKVDAGLFSYVLVEPWAYGNFLGTLLDRRLRPEVMLLALTLEKHTLNIIDVRPVAAKAEVV